MITYSYGYLLTALARCWLDFLNYYRISVTNCCLIFLSLSSTSELSEYASLIRWYIDTARRYFFSSMNCRSSDNNFSIFSFCKVTIVCSAIYFYCVSDVLSLSWMTCICSSPFFFTSFSMDFICYTISSVITDVNASASESVFYWDCCSACCSIRSALFSEFKCC